MLVPDRVLAKSEFYNDHLRLNGDLFHLCAMVLRLEPGAIAAISLLRSRRAGPFEGAHLSTLRVLLPHFQRAMQLHRNFVELRAHDNMLTSALDQVALAIVFVDVSGRVILANRSGDALLKRRDGLLSTHEGLRASSAHESSELEKLIRTAVLTGNGKGLFPGGAMQITRAAPRSPLTLLIAPISAALAGFVEYVPAAAIFVGDPEERVEPNSEILRRLYGLTTAECALSSLLAHGNPLHRAADERHVTIATARSQLKGIFRKLNVASQSQLVRFVLLISQVHQ